MTTPDNEHPLPFPSRMRLLSGVIILASTRDNHAIASLHVFESNCNVYGRQCLVHWMEFWPVSVPLTLLTLRPSGGGGLQSGQP
jgi:hypothetical protein